jgi:hypothetical protein
MDDVETLYKENKLLARAMDLPMILVNSGKKYYDCNTWACEFDLLMNDQIDSLSTTLIVSDVGVRTYKNVGFLMNSDLVECIHVSDTDSSSYGSVRNGDFHANDSDLSTVSELANYVKDNNATEMNEVNVNASIDSVVGLFINKCQYSNYLLKNIYAVKYMLKKFTGIDYPIYLYDFLNGKLELIDLTKEEEEELMSTSEASYISYWPDSLNEGVFEPIESSTYGK